MKRTIPFLCLLYTVTAGCSQDSPLDNEQYYKQVYIVGADETTNMGMSVAEIPYHDTEEQRTFISVATGGSLNIDRDITVTIEEAGTLPVENYNFKYLTQDNVQYRLLPSAHYRIPGNKVVIKAGQVYGQLPVFIKSAGLHCDSLYALTFKIREVSDPDYITVREKDTVLIQSYTFVNKYSGTYQSEGYNYRLNEGGLVSDSTTISATRNLKAVDAHTVRLFHLAYTESDENIDAYALTLTVEEDNTLTVRAWNNLNITGGGGTYSAANGTFTVWYHYESAGNRYRFAGTFTRSDT